MRPKRNLTPYRCRKHPLAVKGRARTYALARLSPPTGEAGPISVDFLPAEPHSAQDTEHRQPDGSHDPCLAAVTPAAHHGRGVVHHDGGHILVEKTDNRSRRVGAEQRHTDLHHRRNDRKHAHAGNGRPQVALDQETEGAGAGEHPHPQRQGGEQAVAHHLHGHRVRLRVMEERQVAQAQ